MRASRSALLLIALAAVACSGPTKPAASPTAASPGGMMPAIDRVTPLPDPLPKVAARVNGRDIALPYVEIIAKRILANGDKDKERPFAYRQATQQLILREMLLEEAVARKLNADDSKVEQAYNESRLGYRDEDAWKTFLANQGLTVDAFRGEIRTQQTIQVLLDQETSQVRSEVSEQEARAFYQANPTLFDSGERLKVRHILVRLPQGSSESLKEGVRSQVKQLIARLKKGEDFEKIAKQYSQDVGSAAKGGKLDEFTRGQLAPAFEQAAFALKPGELSDVVETPFGFHVIRLDERLPSERLSFETSSERIKQHILNTRRQKAVERLVGSLRAKARIETYL